MKLNREAMRHYLDSTFGNVASSANWVILGDDIEEMSVELNSDTETTKTILGQTKTKDNGYEPSMDADPFYADPDNKLYPKIRDIALQQLKGDECKTLMLEVIVEDTEAENHLAFTQEVIVKPQSYGGDTSGVNIPFNVSFNGKRTKGYVSAATLAENPTFTEGEIPLEMKVEEEESESQEYGI